MKKKKKIAQPSIQSPQQTPGFEQYDIFPHNMKCK